MSKAREISQLLDKAHEQGFESVYTGSGHWKVYNPKTDQSTFISSTPKSDRSVTSAKGKLKKIGFLDSIPLDRLRQRKQRKQRKQEQRESEVPMMGETVKLQGVIPATDVRKDIALASYVVWQAIRNRMDAYHVSSNGDSHSWSGFQRDVINELWSGLSDNVMTEITAYLRDSRNVQVRGNTDNGLPVYHVSHEFNELGVQPKEIEVNTLEKIAAVAAAPKPNPLGLTAKGEPRLKAPSRRVRAGGKWEHLRPNEQGFYVCKDAIGPAVGCRFATKQLASFTSHQGKLKGKHPDDLDFNVQCKFCDDFYPTAKRLSDHTRRFHESEHTFFCPTPTCWEYYEETPTEHRRVRHGLAFFGKSPEIAESAEASEPMAEWQDDRPDVRIVGDELYAADAPGDPIVEHTRWVTIAHKNAEHDAAYSAITTILDEVSDLRSENAALSKANGILSEENARLREQEVKFAKMAALFSEL